MSSAVHQSSSTINSRPDVPSIHILPNEILSRIFVLGAQIQSGYMCLPPEVLVTHICTRWREAALANRRLWSNIDCSRFAPDQVAAYLERSRDAPLEITTGHYSRGDDFWANLDFLLNHIDRWWSFSATETFKHHLAKIVDRLGAAECAPALEHVALECNSKASPLINRIPFRGNMPNLKTFSLTKISVIWEESDVWSNIESLALVHQRGPNRPNFPTFVRMLTSSGKLTELVLLNSGPISYPNESDTHPSPASYPICIPSLKALELQGSATRQIIPFLTHFHCPNITRLRLSAWSSSAWDVAFEFLASPPSAYGASILSRLKELNTYGANVSGEPLSRAVNCLDELHALILGNNASEEWLSFLERPRRSHDMREAASSSASLATSRMYLPKLISITFEYRICSLRRARCIAECRKKAGLPLRTLCLYVLRNDGAGSSEASDEEDEQWLRENVSSFVLYH